MKTIFTSLIFMALGSAGAAHASCGPNHCDVTHFPGTTDEQFEAAIAAAKAPGGTQRVYIPNGTYNITDTIQISPLNTHEADINFKIIGASDTGVILNYTPPVCQATNGNSLPPMFNIDQAGGFNSFYFELKRVTIDMSAVRSHCYFTNPSLGTSHSAHGIRVGNGWDDNGRLNLTNIRINNAGGYGIGIQTIDQDKNANNIIMNNIHIENSGMDAIDTKSPKKGLNKNLRIFNLYVNQIGQNDERTSVGIDIRYYDSYIRGYSFYSNPTVVNPRSQLAGTQGAQTVGVAYRPQAGDGTTGGPAPANKSILRNVEIERGNRGITFDGNNSNITVKAALIHGSQSHGIEFINSGSGNELKVGCVWNTGGNPVEKDANSGSVIDSFLHGYGSSCPLESDVGSNYRIDF